MEYDASFDIVKCNDGTTNCLEDTSNFNEEGLIYSYINSVGGVSSEYKILPKDGSVNLGDILKGNTDKIVDVLTGQKDVSVLGNEIQALLLSEVKSQTKQFIRQSQHYDKKDEHLDFAKNGDENVKDSDGEVIKPREVQSRYHAEKHIDEKRSNQPEFKNSSISLDTIYKALLYRLYEFI